MAADLITRNLIEGGAEPIQVQSLAELGNPPAKVSWVEIPLPGRRARINGDCIASLSLPKKKLIRIETKSLLI